MNSDKVFKTESVCIKCGSYLYVLRNGTYDYYCLNCEGAFNELDKVYYPPKIKMKEDRFIFHRISDAEMEFFKNYLKYEDNNENLN